MLFVVISRTKPASILLVRAENEEQVREWLSLKKGKDILVSFTDDEIRSLMASQFTVITKKL